MKGVYTATIEITGVTTAQTLLYLKAPADIAVEVLSATVTNGDNDTAEQIVCELKAVSGVTAATMASAITPTPTEGVVDGGQVASSTVSGNASAEPHYYELTHYDKQGVNNLGGYEFVGMPEERIVLKGQTEIGLRTTETIASTMLIAQIRFREIG